MSKTGTAQGGTRKRLSEAHLPDLLAGPQKGNRVVRIPLGGGPLGLTGGQGECAGGRVRIINTRESFAMDAYQLSPGQTFLPPAISPKLLTVGTTCVRHS